MDIYPLIKDVPHNVWNAIPEMIAWLTYEYVLEYSYALKFKEVTSYSCASSGAECSLKNVLKSYAVKLPKNMP